LAYGFPERATALACAGGTRRNASETADMVAMAALDRLITPRGRMIVDAGGREHDVVP
jgi:hypothetical protein